MDDRSTDRSEREIIPVRPQSWLVRRPWPGVAPRKVALGVVAGAAGSIFLKRLIELAAEDLYRRGKALAKQMLERAAAAPEITSAPPVDPLLPEAPPERVTQGVFLISVTRLEWLALPRQAIAVRWRMRGRRLEVPLLENSEDAPLT